MDQEKTTSEVRTPYKQRSTWMAERHRLYGRECHLLDIDSMEDMWIEHKTGELVALAEWKQDYEEIHLWKYKPMKTLADNSKIPFYIVVGYEKAKVYYTIPMNEFAKKIPNMGTPHFVSERNYVRFLHFLRKIEPDQTILEKLNNKIPAGLKLPNIKS